MWAVIWVLGTEPQFSAKAGSALNHWTISPALKNIVWFEFLENTLSLFLTCFFCFWGYNHIISHFFLISNSSIYPSLLSFSTNFCNMHWIDVFSGLTIWYQINNSTHLPGEDYFLHSQHYSVTYSSLCSFGLSQSIFGLSLFSLCLAVMLVKLYKCIIWNY